MGRGNEGDLSSFAFAAVNPVEERADLFRPAHDLPGCLDGQPSDTGGSITGDVTLSLLSSDISKCR